MWIEPEVIVDHDELHRTVYRFWFKDGDLYLDKALYQTRYTKRHKFRTDMMNSYSRIDQRSYGIKEEPDIDIDIQYEAVRQIRSMIKFRKWREKSV